MALLAGAAVPAVAEASGRHHRRSHADADIESIDARLRYVGGAWRLNIRYEIEIEDASRRDRFDLVLSVVEQGRRLRDRHGRPMTIVIPLDRPTKVDDDEIEFERSITLRIPAGAIDRPSRLRVIAKVVEARSGRVLDRDKESVEVRRVVRRSRWVRRSRSCSLPRRW